MMEYKLQLVNILPLTLLLRLFH